MTERQQYIGKNALALEEILPKIADGLIVTKQIKESRLPNYQEAALKTGFTVNKIAEQDEMFIMAGGGMRIILSLENDRKPHIATKPVGVIGATVSKGNIAVSVERPEGIANYSNFWETLRNLDKNQTSPSLKSI